MVTMVSTISGHAMMAILMGTLAHPFWFANAENQYLELFGHHIPSWATVRSREVLRGYFQGDSSLYLSDHWRAWVGPVLFWSAFIFLLYSSFLFTVLLFRKQWSEHEKLSFPLTQLPLHMATDRSFFRSRVLWLGIALAATIRVLAGLHDLFPVVPALPASIRIDPYIQERPWRAMGYISLSLNPAVVGLSYFMPLDLAFSCWFFFWLTRVERVIADVAGWRELHLNERASGAWIGIALIAIWSGRRHLARVFRFLLGREDLDEATEPIRYRWTAVGLLVSLGGVFLLCLALGMSLWAVLVFYALTAAPFAGAGSRSGGAGTALPRGHRD
ncbi:MAG: hypothetical protein KatS3mg115_1229 [Candidatus Poribacteria bacterium]|nr:MAG: hypothetical protein KatS3mg115_1229 [Candidatus Poribacteria bacterium]